MEFDEYIKRTWVVIPAFNEAGAINNTVKSVIKHFSNVIVVDDCSKDNTYDIAYESGANVIRHPINMGQGASLQTGIEFALMNDASSIVTFDADGQHSAEDAVEFVRILWRENVDVVLGSRFLGRAINMSTKKRLFLKLAVIYTRLTTGLRVTDTHNGLRAISAGAARDIHITQNRMAHASEILSLIASKRLRYVEAPCTIVYTNYSMQKGQKMSGAIAIIFDLIIRGLYK